MSEENALAGVTATTPSEQAQNAQSSPETTPNAQTPDTAEGEQPTAETPVGEPSPETPEGQKQEADQAKKPKSPAAERIAHLIRERNEAEIRAYAAEQELRRLRRPIPAKDGETDIQRAVREAREAEREGRLEETKEIAETAKAEARAARLTLFSEKVGDQAVVEAFCRLPRVSEELADLVAESDHARALAMRLNANPGEARRLSSLPPHRLGAEIARMEAKLATQPAVRTVSQAPEPSKVTLKGGSNPRPADPNSMSVSEMQGFLKKAKVLS